MKLPSLRRRMLWRVLLPLGLVWLTGSAVALAVAAVYTRKAFDRSLLSDAYTIGVSVVAREGELQFGLSPSEVAAVLFDDEERTFFAVLRPDGSLIAGQGGLRDGLPGRLEPLSFEDRHYRGLDLRVATLWRELPLPHAVVVAQTTHSRGELLRQLLAASLVPQALLLLALGTWLRRSIADELRPLLGLEQALERRDASDLTPIALMPRTRDIAQLAGAFNALLGRIADAVRAQREFAGNVAHELRTPLAGIRSLAEYGLSQARPEVWSRQLGLISQSERRASHLVEQLLALALADEARNSLRLVPVPVHEVVQELLTRLLTQADDLGVDLGAAGLERPVWVLGTRGLVEGILGNLTDNALRYGHCTQPGQESRVTVEIECQSSQVQISVTDNGPGLSAEERQRVRSRWEQGALGTRSAGGVGLGLAIVERYVALLGGDFALEAAPGGPGLRAVVWLRAVSDPQMDGKSGPPATFAAVSSAVSSAVSEAVPEAVPEADPVTAAPALASALALPPSLPGRPASQGLSAPR